MKNTAINEKTLELNICEEYLVAIRKDHPNAYWYGPSTIEERDLGYDASMENTEGEFLFLQFKRPLRYYRTTPKKYPYVFKVQTHQHQILRDLSAEFPGAVQYAFPLLGDLDELEAAVPNLRSETNFYHLEDAPDLDRDKPEHKVEVYRDYADFYSTPKRVRGFNGRFVLSNFKARNSSRRAVWFIDFVSLHDSLIERAFAVDTALDGSLVIESMDSGNVHPAIVTRKAQITMSSSGRHRDSVKWQSNDQVSSVSDAVSPWHRPSPRWADKDASTQGGARPHVVPTWCRNYPWSHETTETRVTAFSSLSCRLVSVGAGWSAPGHDS